MTDKVDHRVCYEDQMIGATGALKYCYVCGKRFEIVPMTEREWTDFYKESRARWGQRLENAPNNFDMFTGERIDVQHKIEK